MPRWPNQPNTGFQKGDKNPSWKGGVNTENVKKYNKQWQKDNKELCSYYSKQRYYRKRGADGSHTYGEWELLKAQYNWTCPCCKKSEPDIKLEADHIIPITKGGSNNIENIQPLCRSCNAKKHTKIIKY